ncbi:hypothetical protein C7M84_009975 [Penaeus vannamei]|uniref:Uncharacterized protein n=1 Tax=Penaeus vannamei TaxID=6689 RepID=A0A423T5I6_PENVA|nr:hypothetical protein C7M84_009975 [Penaeus vannamei]
MLSGSIPGPAAHPQPSVLPQPTQYGPHLQQATPVSEPPAHLYMAPPAAVNCTMPYFQSEPAQPCSHAGPYSTLASGRDEVPVFCSETPASQGIQRSQELESWISSIEFSARPATEAYIRMARSRVSRYAWSVLNSPVFTNWVSFKAQLRDQFRGVAMEFYGDLLPRAALVGGTPVSTVPGTGSQPARTPAATSPRRWSPHRKGSRQRPWCDYHLMEAITPARVRGDDDEEGGRYTPARSPLARQLKSVTGRLRPADPCCGRSGSCFHHPSEADVTHRTCVIEGLRFPGDILMGMDLLHRFPVRMILEGLSSKNYVELDGYRHRISFTRGGTTGYHLPACHDAADETPEAVEVPELSQSPSPVAISPVHVAEETGRG